MNISGPTVTNVQALAGESRRGGRRPSRIGRLAHDLQCAIIAVKGDTTMTENTEKQIKERLTELETRLLQEVNKHLGNVQNTSSSDPTELLDMVSEGEIDYMAALSAQADSAALDEIQTALTKLQEGTYGTCEDCGDNIGDRRLEVRPFAILCVRCKERQERGGYAKRPSTVAARGGSDVYVSLTDEDREPPESSAADVMREMEDVETSEMF